jgi:hypothetical protein
VFDTLVEEVSFDASVRSFGLLNWIFSSDLIRNDTEDGFQKLSQSGKTPPVRYNRVFSANFDIRRRIAPDLESPRRDLSNGMIFKLDEESHQIWNHRDEIYGMA